VRHVTWIFVATMMLAASAPLAALNYEVGGCKSGSAYKNFTSISAAVGAVPPGSTILVCPGVYPEQVTIRQPLTLKGIPSGNAGRAVITADATGNFGVNVTAGGSPAYAQVLVENVSPVGPVNLVGITVDGNGINFDCPSSSQQYLIGIFYGSNVSGTINMVTARNQLNTSSSGACAYGIWAENESAASQTINIHASSVHNTGSGGITAGGFASTLTANIGSNFVTNTALGGNLDTGISSSAAGTIDGNVVTLDSNFAGIGAGGAVNVLRNTVADSAWGFDISRSGTTVQSNNVSNVQVGIATEGYAATIKANSIMHTTGCALTFNHTSSTGTVSGNKINDSPFAFANWLGPTITGNVLFNIDQIQSTNTNFCP
jgi:hypothetical protein